MSLERSKEFRDGKARGVGRAPGTKKKPAEREKGQA